MVGRTASMRAVRDDVKVLLVLWYVEVHMDGHLSVLGGHLINLQLAQALILGIFFGHGLIRSTTWQEWPHSLSYQHTTFTAVESCMMPDLESKVQEVGLVSKSVEANASSDS